MRAAVSHIASVVILSICPATCACAATFAPGTLEFWPEFSAAYTSQTDGAFHASTTSVSLNTRIGCFLSKLIEVEGGPLLRYNSYDFLNYPFSGRESSGSTSAVGIAGGVTLNPPVSGAFAPYLRVEAGVLASAKHDFPNSSRSYALPTVAAGVRAMVGSSAAIDFGVSFEHGIHPLFLYSDAPLNILSFTVGMSMFPRLGM